MIPYSKRPRPDGACVRDGAVQSKLYTEETKGVALCWIFFWSGSAISISFSWATGCMPGTGPCGSWSSWPAAALLALTVLSFRSGVAAVGVLLAVVWAAWAFHFFVTLLHRRPKPQKRGWNSAFGKHI